MKLLIINQHISLVTGGSELQCHYIADHLTNEGYEVLYGVVTDEVSNLKNINVNYKFDNYNISRPYKFLKKFKKDGGKVLYWRHNRKGLFLTFILCKILNINLFFAASSIDDVMPLKANLNKKNLKSIKSRSKTFIQSLMSYLIYPCFKGVILLNSDLYGFARNKNKIVIRNSVILDKEYVDIDLSSKYVVWAASIKESKNPDLFIEIAELSKKKSSDIKFIMVGKLVDHRYKDALLKADNMSNFSYLGAVTPGQVNYLLSNALCLVHTCEPEGFGNIFIQAWGLGIPTITTYFDPEGLISENKAGFSNLKSVENVLANVEKCMCSETRNRLSKNAKSLYAKNFNGKRNINELKKFLGI